MRSTLLQVQYLCSWIGEQVDEQNRRFEVIQKDRMVQVSELQAKCKELSTRNFTVVLIAKLEELLAYYVEND